MREGELHRAGGDLRQDLALLRIAAGQAERGGAQHDRRQIRLQHQVPAEGLHQQHDVDRAAAEAAMLLGDRQAEQAELGIALPECLAPARWRLQQRLALLEAVFGRQQPGDAVAQQALVVGEIEVHYSPSTALFRMFFWISLVPP